MKETSYSCDLCKATLTSVVGLVITSSMEDKSWKYNLAEVEEADIHICLACKHGIYDLVKRENTAPAPIKGGN